MKIHLYVDNTKGILHIRMLKAVLTHTYGSHSSSPQPLCVKGAWSTTLRLLPSCKSNISNISQ